MWNPFKKTSTNSDGTQKLGMLQRLAMKRVEKMSQEEREKMMQDALKPENRDKLLKAMEQMKKSGMISESQIQKAKEKLGL
jgi:DNA polymerase III delta prime subunit